ncbi:transcriptional repressor [Arthrobacter crusticola]|uniref:Transcriptional repressor n=2 Tax=Arthrobacter crusticola TaxID=2547960 RepID=A0A4R5TP81_9MICC|nr:transcriptional repressor [Arthrobacter crusticola]
MLRQSIRAAGLKVTAPRVAVLEVLQHNPHSSAEQVFTKVQDILSGSSTQAVYGILAAFTSAGLARRFDPAGHPALFESRVEDHHHLVCVCCGAVQDVDCVIGEAPCLTPSDSSGFAIFGAEVTFNGLCRPCQNQAETGPAE